MSWEVALDEVIEAIRKSGVSVDDVKAGKYKIIFSFGDSDWNLPHNDPRKWWRTEGVERIIWDKRGYEWVEGGKLIWGEKKSVPYGRVWLGGTPGTMRMGDMYTVNVYLVPAKKEDEFLFEIVLAKGTIAVGVVEI